MINTKIFKYQPEREYFFEEGCFITELANCEHDTEVSIARARVLPGDRTRWHILTGTVERYVILEGVGQVEVGEELSEEVTAGDVVLIPAGLKQRIANVGKTDLIFLAICSPRFQRQNYKSVK